MKLQDLRKYGIPEMIIEAWIKRQGEYLLPLQEKAVMAGLLDNFENNQAGNLLVSAPTSSGKSFCAEMAAMAAMLRRERAIMLLPLKSIAEEKFEYFNRCYSPLGIKTIIATGDHPENDDDFLLGNFNLAVVIYEKFNRLLTVNLDILRQVGLVIVDELQMIGDSGRGGELELALTKLNLFHDAPRLIALSAVLGDESTMANWLDCRILKETVRPVDLFLGIASGGEFHFRSFNSGREGCEKFQLPDGDNSGERLIQLCKDTKSRKLVFLKSKQDTIDAAFRLASQVKWPEAKKTLERLDEGEPSFLIRSLRQTLSRGVAFHNADLTIDQRRAIEAGYRAREIQVIFSTPTLAMGVNLPAETVFLETMKYVSGASGNRAQLLPISSAEFQNITGRAGRFGVDPGGKPGRAVVLANNDFEHEVLWANYIEPQKIEGIQSVLSMDNIHDIALDFIVSGIASDRESLERALSQTLYVQQTGLSPDSGLESILENLISAELIGEDIKPTPVGIAAAEGRLLVKSACRYRAILKQHIPETLAGWLALALNNDQFDISCVSLTSNQYAGRLSENILHQRFHDCLSDIEGGLNAKNGEGPLDYYSAAILKAVFVLSDWADSLSVEKLEQRYQLRHGQIVNLADTAAWLLRSLSHIIEADDSHSRLPELLQEYAFRVQYGIPSIMHDIHRVIGNEMNRLEYKKLEDAGIVSINDFGQSSAEILNRIITSERKLIKIHEKIETLQKEDAMRTVTDASIVFDQRLKPADARLTFRPSSIEIDGSYERERYLVKIDGFPVRLTGKSFTYLVRLVFARLMENDGWIYKDDIENGFNQARYLYRLKQEVNREAGFSWPIFENNRLGYYRLDLKPTQIKVNLDNLKSFPDYEISEITEQLAIRQAG